ncbi:hypothetical protein TRVL_07493 [Trypanosoma vivax]|nr:hypothetical protein TRVL_07493 [Trypanosoma vivax]
MALRARGPLTLVRGILGKEPSHGNCTLRDGGASEMNDPTVLPVVFARVRNNGWALAHCVAHRFAHRESNAEFRRISAKGFFFCAPQHVGLQQPNLRVHCHVISFFGPLLGCIFEGRRVFSSV